MWWSLQCGGASNVVEPSMWWSLQCGGAFNVVEPPMWCGAFNVVEPPMWCGASNVVWSLQCGVEPSMWWSLQCGGAFNVVEPPMWWGLQCGGASWSHEHCEHWIIWPWLYVQPCLNSDRFMDFSTSNYLRLATLYQCIHY